MCDSWRMSHGGGGGGGARQPYAQSTGTGGGRGMDESVTQMTGGMLRMNMVRPGQSQGQGQGRGQSRLPDRALSTPRAPTADEQDRHNEHCLDLLATRLGAEDQLLVVLVGLPGCGKSTFASQIKTACPDGAWCVACQDVLGDRHKVVSQVTRVLEGTADGFLGGRVLVDRCNFDQAQRRHWIEIVQQQRRANPDLTTHLLCVVLSNSDDADFCAARAVARGNDGVHAGDEDWPRIVAGMKRDYRPPSLHEGFDGIFWCHSEEDAALIQTMLVSAPSLFAL